MYSLHVKYVGAKSVLVADTLSRLVKPGTDPAVPDLNITVSQVLKIRQTHVESLQEETKADPTLSPLRDFIINGWPDSVHNMQEALRPYWCFRDELTILDGLVMKGNRVVVPSALRAETLARLHGGHQGLTTTLQRTRRSVYWPNMQDDISDLLFHCNECQIHGKKKPRVPERQVSASRPMEIIGIDLMEFKGKTALVSVDYYSGCLTFDFIQAGTSEEVVKVLDNNFRKLGLAERVISDNGPCFKSEKFKTFCTALEIKHTTSSPHYHEANGRAERSIQTIKQILRKCSNEVETTMAVLAYLDTPVSSDLPSPAELFFNRRINTRLGLMYQPTVLTDTQKTKLSGQRSAHIKPARDIVHDEYVPDQPIWFTEDGCPEWKPGHIESRDVQPDSYWIINAESTRRLRRNRHDIKPRYSVPKQAPATNQDIVPFYKQLPANDIEQSTPTPAEAPNLRATDAPTEIPISNPIIPVAVPTPTPRRTDRTSRMADKTPHAKVKTPRETKKTPHVKTTSPTAAKSPVTTRSGRLSKSNRDPSFVYCSMDTFY